MWQVKTLTDQGEVVRSFDTELQAVAFAIQQLSLTDVLVTCIVKPSAKRH